MKLPKVLNSVRYSLIGLNGIFLLSGLLLLFMGITILVLNKEYEDLISQRFFKLPSFLIATGIIILCTSILGFYGAVSQHFYFIAAYVIILIAVLIFEIAMCIVGYGLYNDAISEITPTMTATIRYYTTRIETAKMWDDLQTSWQCCGVRGLQDWGTSNIPVSCCHIDFGTLSPFHCTSDKVYTSACATLLGNWLSYNAFVIGVSAVVLTCLQVLIVAGAGWLAWRSRYEEVELES